MQNSHLTENSMLCPISNEKSASMIEKQQGGWASITANNTTQYPKTTTPKTSQPTFSHAVIGPSTKEIKRGQTVQQTSIWLLNSTNCGMCADCCFY